MLSTLQIAPTAGGNGVGDLSNELDYARAHSSFSSIQLEAGTQPFRANLVSAITGG